MLQSTCSRTWQRQLIALLFASTACAWTGPPPPDGAVEEESKRTETSRTYVLPNGTHHLIVLATKDAPLPPHEVGDVIDPIFPGDTSDGLIDGSSSNYNAACNTATAATTSGNLQVGRVVSFGPYEIDRSFVAFDTSAITSANTVTSVRMNLMVGGNSSVQDFIVRVNDYDWPAPLTVGSQTLYSTCRGSLFDAAWQNTAVITTELYYPSDPLNTGYVNVNGMTRYCLVSERDIADATCVSPPSVNEYVTIYSSETFGKGPYLDISYVAAGTPTQTRTITPAPTNTSPPITPTRLPTNPGGTPPRCGEVTTQ